MNQMKKNNRVFAETKPLLTERFGQEQTQIIMKYAEEKFQQLCADNAQETKAVKAHTAGDIYPCISLYYGLQKAGIDCVQAVAFLDWSYSKRAEPKAQMMRNMAKIPGVYQLIPVIFRWVTMHQFGEKTGFRAKFYPTDHTRVKFDMTQCLYCDVCRKYGCPELIPCFCHTDDVTNGKIHPNLCWNRTKIMGDGGDVCDFDLIVKKEK